MTQLKSLWRGGLTVTVACLAFAGAEAVQAQSDELELSVDLDGAYATGVAITDGLWDVSEAETLITLVFSATGMADVNQFEFILSFEPASAFDIDIARFRGFVSEDLGGVEVQGLSELEDDGRLRFAGGVLGDVINGDSDLGTLQLTTSATFFSIGPSADDRDSYDQEALGNMGVIVAAGTAVESTPWGLVKRNSR